jgi:single stranded DNA-binding protein
MRQLNRFEVVGNLGNSPEEFNTNGGQKGARFELCNNQAFGSVNNRQERQNWFTVIVWSPRLAEMVASSLKKGDQVQVAGELRMRNYNKRVTLENGETANIPIKGYDLIANRVQPVGRLTTN